MSDRITVVGNVATTPERRRTASGVTVISFRLATNHRRRDANGQWVDSATNWYTVSGYRALAEHALASFVKGQRVIVTGALRVRDWESNGKHGREAEIDADALGHDLLWGTTMFARDHADGSPLEQNGNGQRHGSDGYSPGGNGRYENGNDHHPQEDGGPYQSRNGSYGQNGNGQQWSDGGSSSNDSDLGRETAQSTPPRTEAAAPPAEAADWGAPREPVDSDTPF